MLKVAQPCWHMTLIPEVGRQRPEDAKLKGSTKVDGVRGRKGDVWERRLLLLASVGKISRSPASNQTSDRSLSQNALLHITENASQTFLNRNVLAHNSYNSGISIQRRLGPKAQVALRFPGVPGFCLFPAGDPGCLSGALCHLEQHQVCLPRILVRVPRLTGMELGMESGSLENLCH